jgi:general stress protein YciG
LNAATKHPLYPTWQSMKRRCTDPQHFAYHRYGGRGISVCEAWGADFWSFARDMGDRLEGHTLDRINNDGNYEPGNCRWANQATQSANRILGRILTWNGLSLTVPRWADRVGLPDYVLRKRLRKGWSVEQALTEPLGLPLAKRSVSERRAIARQGGKAVPKHKRSFSRNRSLAVAAGAKGGGAVPAEKRSFFTDRALASKAGTIARGSRTAAQVKHA